MAGAAALIGWRLAQQFPGICRRAGGAPIFHSPPAAPACYPEPVYLVTQSGLAWIAMTGDISRACDPVICQLSCSGLIVVTLSCTDLILVSILTCLTYQHRVARLPTDRGCIEYRLQAVSPVKASERRLSTGVLRRALGVLQGRGRVFPPMSP